MDDAWTINELAEHAVAALTSGASMQVNGRVRDQPNERLIRWYTTIGLLDPPLGRRGRTALYGRRHLLQLVAVKRRQAAGHSIAEIQLELAAATDPTLEQIAALPSPGQRPPETTPPPVPAPGPASAPHPAPGPRRESDRSAGSSDRSADGVDEQAPARGRFWSARPDISFRDITGTGSTFQPSPTVVQGIKLAPDVTLLLEAAALTGDDLAAVQHAARPLLRELHRRGLLTSSGHAPADVTAPTGTDIRSDRTIPDDATATSDITATPDPTAISADPPGRPQ